jgi:hypothetical protein
MRISDRPASSSKPADISPQVAWLRYHGRVSVVTPAGIDADEPIEQDVERM